MTRIFRSLTPDDIANQVLTRVLDVSSSPSARPIAVEIAKEIIEGERPQEYELSSVQLAEKFGTSRAPIREALSALNQCGIVHLQSRRKPKVRAFSQKEAEEIYHVRGIIYSAAAPLFVENHDASHLDELTQIVKTLGSASMEEDLDHSLWLNVAFREVELLATGHNLLNEIHDQISLRAMILRRKALTEERLQRSWSDHSRILTAYLEGDALTAQAISKSIVHRGLTSLLTVI